MKIKGKKNKRGLCKQGMQTTTTLTQPYRQRLRGLYDDAVVYRSHWKEIAEYTLPDRGRYLVTKEDKQQWEKGAKVHGKIINNTAQKSLRTLAAGMQGGLTSPSRPWFALETPDKDLLEYAPVKEWLFKTRQIMLNTLTRSNFYNTVHTGYSEIGAFGTSAILIEESLKTVVRFLGFTIGEYYITLDKEGIPNGLYRHFSYTALQLEEKFGREVMSDAAITALINNKAEYRFEVVHAIEPNPDHKPGMLDTLSMEYASVYFEVKGDPDVLLKKSGYSTKPFVVPRWLVFGSDSYGVSPGMDSLGDAKMLQKMEVKKLEAIDKEVDPPMNATNELKAKGGNVVPGGINYMDTLAGGTGFSPAYQVRMNIPGIAEEIRSVENRIKSTYYNDLFLAVLQTDKRMTATEVAERHTEKMLMLGPVLERFQSEALNPIIDRVFTLLNERNMIPPAPEEMEGLDLEVEYISTLAQAQKAVGTESIERVVGFAAGMVEVAPEIMDKIDTDQSVDRYAAMIGAPPEIVRSDEDVEKMRAQRAEQQAKQQKQQEAAAMVEGAKTMSETKLNTDSMLDDYTERAKKGQGQFTEGI